MKRTLRHSMLKRYAATAAEADLLDKFTLSASLMRQIEKNADDVREEDEDYHYNKEELLSDVKDAVWDALTRLADFYQIDVDEEYLEDLAVDTTEQLNDDFCRHHNVSVGAYEDDVAGEDREKTHEEADEDSEDPDEIEVILEDE